MKLLGMSLGMNPGTIALGAAAVLFGPAVLAMAGSLVRPIAKAGIKGGLMLYQGGKKMVEDTRCSINEITQEARREISAPSKTKSQKAA